jgi:poly-gamma-glutamate capsule biosynthesis protein CapA/YwtB (metallophosphatase superfamily)
MGTEMEAAIRLALAGDTMLGRGVAASLATRPPQSLFSDEVVEVLRGADLVVLNLECCISERGERWHDPDKPFFFRAPPRAVEVLSHLGVDCVTLANNHALDYGHVALLDTLDLLNEAGVAVVGAGRDVQQARAPAVLAHEGFRLRVVGLTDHPRDYQAGSDQPGVAYADLRRGVPDWVHEAIAGDPLDPVDAVLVSPHWGPNMTADPVPHVRSAAAAFVQGGATLVAGHSAHVFHGVGGRVLYDLGDFIDDYAVDPELRNDMGLIFLVDLTFAGTVRLEAIPIFLDFCHTRLARGDEAAWIRRRFIAACDELGTKVQTVGDRLVIEWLEVREQVREGYLP